MLIDVKYFHYIVKRFQCHRHAQLALAQSDGDQRGWGQRMEMLSGTEIFSISNYRNLGFPLLSSHLIIPLGTIATVSCLSVDTIFCAIWLPYNTNNISNKWLWFISVTSETHSVFLFFSLKSITSWPMKQNSQLHCKNLEKKPVTESARRKIPSSTITVQQKERQAYPEEDLHLEIFIVRVLVWLWVNRRKMEGIWGEATVFEETRIEASEMRQDRGWEGKGKRTTK